MKAKSLLAIVILFLAATSVVLVQSIKKELASYQKELHNKESADEIALNVSQKRFLVDDYLLNNTQRAREQWHIKQNTLQELIKTAAATFSESVDEETLFERMRKAIVDSEAVFAEIGAPEISDDKKTRLAAQLTALAQEAVSAASQLSHASAEAAKHAFNSLLLISWGVAGLFFTLLLLSFWVIWGIVAQLAEAKAKDEALLQSLGEGIIAADPSFHVLVQNPAAELMLGWNASEIKGLTLGIDISRIEDEAGLPIPLAQHPFDLALKTGKTVQSDPASKLTFYCVRKNGTRFPVGITATPAILKGKTIGIIVVFRDITREKDLDRAKSEFISIASHQLKTPPVAIRWNTQSLLDSKQRLTKTQRETIEDIGQVNEKMIETINLLLNISRLELGTFIIDPKPVDYRAVAEELLKEYKSTIDQKQLRVEKQFARDLPKVPADQTLAKIILENLLSNAVKYTPKKGKITIGIDVPKGSKNMMITVKDTGVGIPKDQQSSLFTKMFRASNVKEDVEGTGFGLYFLKSIVDTAAGKIEFSSQEGKGTTFKVSLPLSGMKKREGTSKLTV